MINWYKSLNLPEILFEALEEDSLETLSGSELNSNLKQGNNTQTNRDLLKKIAVIVFVGSISVASFILLDSFSSLT